MAHHRPVAVLVVLCIALGTTALVSPPAAAVAAAPAPVAAPAHVPPVDASVVDPFRAPSHPFGPGNRGLEYGTEPGTAVHATADGVVVFAGLVAGTRHITVRHDDDVRTSYSFLDRIDVVVGQRVTQGDVLGTTAGRLHLGARVGDVYFDPATLFADSPPPVRLVPFDLPLGVGAAGERGAIRQLIGGASRVVGGVLHAAGDRVLSSSGATVDWLRDNGPQLLRTVGHYLEPFPVRMARDALNIWMRAQSAARRACTEAGVVVAAPVERRVAVMVAGLGSSSDDGAIDDVDTASLGYETGDVVRFSYAGGRTPGTGASFSSVPATEYRSGDTQGDLRQEGERLADLIEELARQAPGTAIDLYAHSQGGVVSRLALIELERQHGEGWLDRLGLLATLGTPHGGADAATGVYAVGSTERGSQVFDALGFGLGLELDDDAESVAQLSEVSDVIDDLADSPIPAGVDAVSIAARGDLVVPVPRTVAAGATQIVVPVDGLHAHDALPGSREAQRELALALSGRPPGCRSFRSALLGQAEGHLVSYVEDNLAATMWLVALRYGGDPLGG